MTTAYFGLFHDLETIIGRDVLHEPDNVYYMNKGKVVPAPVIEVLVENAEYVTLGNIYYMMHKADKIVIIIGDGFDISPHWGYTWAEICLAMIVPEFRNKTSAPEVLFDMDFAEIMRCTLFFHEPDEVNTLVDSVLAIADLDPEIEKHLDSIDVIIELATKHKGE